MVSSGMSIVAPEALKKFAADIFTKAGLPTKDAETVASVMLWATSEAWTLTAYSLFRGMCRGLTSVT